MKPFSKRTIEEAEDEFHIVLQSGNDMLTDLKFFSAIL